MIFFQRNFFPSGYNSSINIMSSIDDFYYKSTIFPRVLRLIRFINYSFSPKGNMNIKIRVRVTPTNDTDAFESNLSILPKVEWIRAIVSCFKDNEIAI